MSRELELLKEAVALLEEKERKQEVSCTNNDKNNEKVELSTLLPGEIFKIGKYDFIVLKQEEGRTKVISKELMASGVQFDDEIKDYNASCLKKLIENDIQPIIEKEVGADNLIEHEVDLISVDMQQELERCRCKVRPVTFDEAREFNLLLVNKDLNDWWWTCTPWSTQERGWKYSMAVVSPSGCILDNVYYGYNGVRPFCILKSNIFVSKGE